MIQVFLFTRFSSLSRLMRVYLNEDYQEMQFNPRNLCPSVALSPKIYFTPEYLASPAPFSANKYKLSGEHIHDHVGVYFRFRAFRVFRCQIPKIY